MKRIGECCNLSELNIGQVAIIKNLNMEDKKVRRHLLDMGFTRGVKIKVKKIAPMGDPIDIELRDYEIAIRKSDLKQIEVEVIK